MIISHDFKFIFLSPWKTASSTTWARLSSYNQSPYPGFFYFNAHLRRVVHQHITLAEFMALPEGRLDYLIACFTRNPYDRAYSGFMQLQRDIAVQPKAEYPEPWIKELVKAQLARNQKRIIEAEYDFDKWITLLPEYEIYEVGCNTNMPLHPATYWTHREGIQVVNFIGRVEQFEEHFARFCNTIGITTPSVNSNISSNIEYSRTEYRHISKMSNRSIHIINEIFRDDFDFLDYRMIK